MTSQKKRSVFSLFYVPAVIFLLAYIFITIKQQHALGGWALMLFFLSLSIAFRGDKFLKGFSYTFMILAAVSMAIYYPQHVKAIGGFNLSLLIVP
jgi:BASS family bile acid:Na+ symporter